MGKDPFAGGDKPKGQDLNWWHADAVGERIVGTVDGVFQGKKQEFCKLTDAIVFRVADHKPLRFIDTAAMNNLDAKLSASESGNLAVVTCVKSEAGDKPGISFMRYETTVFRKGTKGYDTAREMMARAALKLSQEEGKSTAGANDSAAGALDAEDDDLPF